MASSILSPWAVAAIAFLSLAVASVASEVAEDREAGRRHEARLACIRAGMEWVFVGECRVPRRPSGEE